MWCKVCNMETNEHVCPVCGTNTVEDIPTEVHCFRDERSIKRIREN
ncbi:MAG: hypothetical protein K6B68_04830 [Eubacterium sp.]|nr:hypothetical protein [Eubacterium sp.]